MRRLIELEAPIGSGFTFIVKIFELILLEYGGLKEVAVA
jgi:hypothetical protein